MTEHLPMCPSRCTEHAFCACRSAECICERLRAYEERAKDEALAWVQAWAQATESCIPAFYDRISDSDLDDVMSDDQKDIVAWEIKRASLAAMRGDQP